ncbi:MULTISPECIES: hypothetical protein [unclassified Bradyrhizobium]|uniref:hypothetical protein n=1 Tax=unclassified Bradyrhizobium TaxID=2631580 RepID=UPI00291626E2|nr:MULTISPECIES: hypothetical protein [unclassified Bradyrhizobium]
MTNKASSFPNASSMPPLHRYGGVLASTPELAMHVLGDAYWVEGTGTVLGLPAWPKGPPIHLYLVGNPTFVNSSKLLMPGGQSYTFSPGDSCWLLPLGDGVWRVLTVCRADGIPFIPGRASLFPKPQTRLTLTQGTPETLADVAGSGATVLYLEPFDGDQVAVFDGVSAWLILPVASSTYGLPATQTQSGTLNGTTAVTGLTDTSQIPSSGVQVTGTNIQANTIFTPTGATTGTLSLAATGSGTSSLTFKLPPNTGYDVLLSSVGGLPKLTWSAAWSNDTTPPPRVLQNGVEVASGATTKRVIGSAHTTSLAGVLEDSHSLRYLSNRYNEVPRQMYAVDPAATWNYSSATMRQANGNAANQISYFACVPRKIYAFAQGMVTCSTTINAKVDIGIDTTSGGSAQLVQFANVPASNYVATNAIYTGTPGIGRHFVAWLEFGFGSGTQTWLGTSAGQVSGIIGEVAN